MRLNDTIIRNTEPRVEADQAARWRRAVHAGAAERLAVVADALLRRRRREDALRLSRSFSQASA